MNEIFFLQLLLTLFVGSTWIFIILFLSQRHGSKVAGFFGGLPSTALLSFFFIGFTQSPAVAAQATTVFPLAYGITALFLVVYAALCKYGFLLAISASLAFWFAISTIIALVRPDHYPMVLILYGLILLFAIFMVECRLKIRSHGKPNIPFSFWQTTIRSILSGLFITLAVLFAKLGGPLFGGIFAAFPAMFISTLTITYHSLGMEFSRAITKPLMITGMITIVLYSIAVRIFYVASGLYLGTFLAMIVSAISAAITFLFIQRKFN